MQEKRKERFFVTGANGFIGSHLVKRGFVPLPVDVRDMDAVFEKIRQLKPDVVVHLAGKSNVDWCDNHIRQASDVNITGTMNVMMACNDNKVPAVLLSSSHIWGGGFWEPASHKEDSKFTPAKNIYGMTMAGAETITADCGGKIVRSCGVFGFEKAWGKLELLKNNKTIYVPSFIQRSYIHVDDFATLIAEYCKRVVFMPPVLHLAGTKTVSSYEFWKEVARQYGIDTKLVQPRRTEKNDMYDAKRPHKGGLDVGFSKKLGFPQFSYIGGIERMKNES